MLASMTAFAKMEHACEVGVISWEIRCVNHRFFEPHFKLPESLVSLENELRNVLRQHLSRGRCDIFLRFSPKNTTETLAINEAYASQVLSQLQIVAEKNHLAFQYNGLDLLRLPGMLHTISSENTTRLSEEVRQTFPSVLQKLMLDRTREGAQIQRILLERIEMIFIEFNGLKQRIPDLLPLLRKRITTALEPLKTPLDQNRLEQEIVYLAHKIDVQEECDRFYTHWQELRDTLKKGGAVGRRLEFLLQELQREINTLGSKANDTLISQHVVEIKVLIEQIREQVQNVE